MTGSHSELLKDPEGAFSQLIRLQEVNKGSEQLADVSDVNPELFRQSSPRRSLKRSTSRESSRNSSRNSSFSLPFGLPTEMNVTDPAMLDTEYLAEPQLKQAKEVSILRLAYLNKPEIPVIVIGTLFAAANGVILPLLGILISNMIKTFNKPPDELKKDSRYWALIFLSLGLASFLINPARTYFFSIAGCKLIQRIRSTCFEKVVCMEVAWFDEPENSSGSIGARLSADAASIRALVGDALSQLVSSFASALAGLVIAFVASWKMAFIVLVLIPLIGVNGYIQAKFMKGFSADAKVCLNIAYIIVKNKVKWAYF